MNKLFYFILMSVFIYACDNRVYKNDITNTLEYHILRCQQNENLPEYSDYLLEICNNSNQEVTLPLNFRGEIVESKSMSILCLSTDTVLKLSEPQFDRWKKLTKDQCEIFVLTTNSFFSGSFIFQDSTGKFITLNLESNCNECIMKAIEILHQII